MARCDANGGSVNATESERELLLPSGAAARGEPAAAPRAFRLSVEVPLFVAFFAAALSGAVGNNFLLFRTCVNTLNYNVSTCEQLQARHTKSEDIKRLEAEVQREAAMMLMTISVLGGLMPATLSFFLGAWSDKHGRKALILWPYFGLMVSSGLLVMFSLLPHVDPWWLVLCFLPYSLAGGDSTLALGCYCYITDITDDSDRSFRLTLLQGIGFLGVFLGAVSSNYLFMAIGYVYLFAFTAAVYTVAWLYAIFCIPESVVDAEKGSICSIFDFSLVKQMCSTCFKARPNSTGLMLFLLILANTITIFIISGVTNIDYLFTRQRFQWMLKEYSIFSAANTVVIVLGMLIGIAFLQNVCRISDAILTIMAYTSSILDTAVRSLATQSWHMYLAGGLSMLGGLCPPLVRSLITKMVSAEEVGQIFALMSGCEAVVPILAPLLYNTVYAATLNTFPGAIYAMSAGLFATCLVLVVVTRCLMFYNPLRRYSSLRSKELDRPDTC